MEKILEVKDLHIHFNAFAGAVRAIRGVNFHLNKGETLAIVGESGSGKSVTTKAVTRILAENAVIDGGEMDEKGEDVLKRSEKEDRQADYGDADSQAEDAKGAGKADSPGADEGGRNSQRGKTFL